MRMTLILTVIALTFSGCGGNRVSQDMFTYQSLPAEDQAFVSEQRTRKATGGATTRRKAPRWVYMDGVLVDTNNAEWIWQESSPTPKAEITTP